MAEFGPNSATFALQPWPPCGAIGDRQPLSGRVLPVYYATILVRDGLEGIGGATVRRDIPTEVVDETLAWLAE
ncbi:MAG: hypothetical protein OXE87_01110 [Chloroflexi bacterium]|nr:hypothetical protein [Chloroflexota bacterium]